jgi:protein-tyrosine phosphatase
LTRPRAERYQAPVLTWCHATRPGSRPSLAIVLPELLIGEYLVPEDAAWLRAAHGVTTVVSLQDDADLASKNLRLAALEAAYRAHGLRFHRIPIPDGDTAVLTARLGALVGLLGELLDGGERVYLHCNGGFNRAPTVAIAYLHAARGLGLSEARDLVKARRQCVPYMRALEEHFAR